MNIISAVHDKTKESTKHHIRKLILFLSSEALKLLFSLFLGCHYITVIDLISALPLIHRAAQTCTLAYLCLSFPMYYTEIAKRCSFKSSPGVVYLDVLLQYPVTADREHSCGKYCFCEKTRFILGPNCSKVGEL